MLHRTFGRVAAAGIRLATLSVAGLLGAAEPAPTDFANGFHMLEELGLPGTAHATFVEMPDLAPESLSEACHPLAVALQPHEPGAWLLPGEGANRTLVRAGRTVSMSTEEAGGSWKPMDAKIEADALLRFIERISKAENNQRPYEFGAVTGSILLAAAELHGAGLRTEAAAIVSRLFELTNGAELPVANAVSLLALAQYAEAADRFQAKFNWKRFDADIRRIASRFGDDLPESAAMLKVAALIRPQVEGKPPPPLRGNGIDPATRKLASELADAKQPMGGVRFGWLLGATGDAQEEEEGSANDLPAARITARKIESLPFLIALLGDGYPIAFMQPGGDRESLDSGDPSGGDDEAVEEVLREMLIPITRGAVARDLLRSAIPGMNGRSDDAPAALALAFQRAIGDGAPDRIAVAYLRSGQPGFGSTGVNWLMKHPGHMTPAEIEAVLLDQLDASDASPNLGAAQTYLSLRAGEAGEFLAQVEKRLKQRADANPDNKEDLERMLAELRELGRKFDPDELITRVLGGDLPVEQATAILARQPGSPALDAMEQSLLERAARSDDARERHLLLIIRSSLPAQRRLFYAAVQGESEVPARPLAPEQAPLWLQLLADSRAPLPDAIHGIEGGTPVRETAAYLVLFQTGTVPMRTLQQLVTLGSPGVEPILARAKAAAAGTPPAEWPPLPDLAAVTPEQRASLVAQFQAAASETVPAWFGNLPPAEQLALIEAIPPESLTRLATTVMRVGATAGALMTGRPTGAALDSELLRELGALAARELAGGKPVYVGAVRTAPFQPITLFGWSGDGVRVILSKFPALSPGTLHHLARARGISGLEQGDVSDQTATDWLQRTALGGTASFCFYGIPAPAGSDTPPSDEPLMNQIESSEWEKVRADATRLRSEIGTIIVGQERVIEQMTVALLCRGHSLIVGVPGLAKTLLVSSLGRILGLSFNRIQFTPDLMPADIVGSEILQQSGDGSRRAFEFTPGPVFANLILADEINRTPPKTQAALLEAMQEKQVTVAGHTRALAEPFIVYATQNPIEHEGTYPLPEAQLDRFLFQILIDYPTFDQEREIIRRTTGRATSSGHDVLGTDAVLALQDAAIDVPVPDHVTDYVLRLTHATRPGSEHADPFIRNYVAWGAGPRASQNLVRAIKALALLRGQPAASVEEVRELAPAVLRHRIVPNYNATGEGVGAQQIVDHLLELVRP